MKVRVLGCSGAIAQGCKTTAFLIDGDLLVDAGTGVGDLTVDEMCAVDRLLLTHSHLDHIAALPLMLDATGSRRKAPLDVYALSATIGALKEHIFNGVIWPDFTRIPSEEWPLIRLHEIFAGQILQLGDKVVEVLPAVHAVPAAGFAVTSERGSWVYSGDTGSNPAFWSRLNQLDVAMLVIETAFSNREQELAQRSLHLSPALLAEELYTLAMVKHFPIYITHTKPTETETIMSEVLRMDQTHGLGSHIVDAIRWLHAGQEFEI